MDHRTNHRDRELAFVLGLAIAIVATTTYLDSIGTLRPC